MTSTETTPPLTYTDLRRVMFWVEAMRQAIASGDPVMALGAVYRGDEWLLARYDSEGVIRPSFVAAEYRACLGTIARIAGPRPPRTPTNDDRTDR